MNNKKDYKYKTIQTVVLSPAKSVERMDVRFPIRKLLARWIADKNCSTTTCLYRYF